MSDRPEVADPPTTDWTSVDDAIAAAGAVGFVAVGDRFDSDLRYLTGFGLPERAAAVVRTAETSVLCPPNGYVTRAARRFDGRVATERVGEPAGERAAAVLDDLGAGQGSSPPATVLVPPTIPHDAAVYLERAGYELASTTVVADARATKSAAELDAIGTVHQAAAAGVSEAEQVLAAADVGDDSVLTSDGRPLTTARLRRATNAELATRGVTDADNTLVAAGSGDRGIPGVGGGDPPELDAWIRVGDPVVVAVAPRGPHGYHGFLSRTFVVDSDGGWERRAYVAVESALDAALAEIEAGVVAAAVGREARAELTAFGFDPGAEAAVDGPGGPGHGIGLSRRERPWLDGDTALEVGNVVAVEPRVAAPEQGVVRLSGLVAVTADGYERLDDGDPSFSPRE
jgi:Xaa-Pro aminopeptidase